MITRLKKWTVCAAFVLSACSSGGGGGNGTDGSAALASLQPYGMSAYARNLGVTLNWPRISGAISYNLYWATSPGGTKNPLIGKTPPYDLPAYGSVVYCSYTVVRAEGESAYSIELPVFPNPYNNNAPNDLEAYAGDGRVQLFWSGVANATQYKVYWKKSHITGTSDPDINIDINSADATSPFLLTGLSNDTPYYFVVTAVIGGIESAVSREVVAMPYAPEPLTPVNVTATPGSGQVSLVWDPVTNATSYSLLWSTSSPVTASAARIDNATSPYVHSGLTNGQTYYYALVAVNSRGPSPLSAEVGVQPSAGGGGAVAATLAGTPPETPKHVKAFTGHEQITINAEDDSDAVRYTIYWKTSSGVTTTDASISDVTLPYTHTGLTDGTSYYYSVVAMNRYGASGLSAEVSAVPQKAFLESTVISQITDKALQDCINTMAADYGWYYVRQVDYLHCDQTGATAITDMTGIDQFPNLVWMHIINDGTAPVVNVGTVAQLANLSELTLSGMQLSSAGVVGALNHLTYLDLYNNSIGDLTPLQSKTDLTYLYLGANGISDITQLAPLTSLRLLWLNDNSISNGADTDTTLSGFTHLTELSLQTNSITSVSPLNGLTGLTRLSLANNQVVDVSPLANLTALRELYLSGNLIGGENSGNVDSLSALSLATTITLTDNITMSCNELSTLITALGSPPVDPTAATSGVNCTDP